MNRTDTTRRGLALLVMLAAAALLSLAWPRFNASFQFLAVDTAIGNYFESREIPSAQLQPLIGRTRQALELHEHYRYWEGLSLLHYLRALDEETPDWERAPELRRSLQAAQEVVRRAPARPRTWLRMARIQAHLQRGEALVLPPLRMSILTGRVEPNLMLARLELGYRYLAGLDGETSALLRDQTVLAWRVDPRALTRAMKSGQLDFEQVRALLAAGSQDIVEEMEDSLDPAV